MKIAAYNQKIFEKPKTSFITFQQNLNGLVSFFSWISTLMLHIVITSKPTLGQFADAARNYASLVAVVEMENSVQREPDRQAQVLIYYQNIVKGLISDSKDSPKFCLLVDGIKIDFFSKDPYPEALWNHPSHGREASDRQRAKVFLLEYSTNSANTKITGILFFACILFLIRG